MPANLTPVYRAAEAEYRAARDFRARIEALEKMLRVIPKHKGTDHLRGSLRKKLSQLKEDRRQEKKAGSRLDLSYVPAQGAGQIVLLGPPNSGKSSLLNHFTNAEPEVAPYPYTTGKPLPGMMIFEDVQIQLVDSPPVSEYRYDGWMSSLVRQGDAVLLVVDPSDPNAFDDIDAICSRLADSKVYLVGFFGERRADDSDDYTDGELSDEQILARLEPGMVELPTILVATKQDLEPRPEDTEALEELLDGRFPFLPLSIETGQGLDRLAQSSFDMLGVMRIYTKPPGREPSLEDPNIIAVGSTVFQLAKTIHKQLAERLTFARIWGDGYHDGQRIGRDQVLRDGDIVELHD